MKALLLMAGMDGSSVVDGGCRCKLRFLWWIWMEAPLMMMDMDEAAFLMVDNDGSSAIESRYGRKFRY